MKLDRLHAVASDVHPLEQRTVQLTKRRWRIRRVALTDRAKDLERRVDFARYLVEPSFESRRWSSLEPKSQSRATATAGLVTHQVNLEVDGSYDWRG
jgi:hypothetical protein